MGGLDCRFLIVLGKNTTATEYEKRAETVQKWWGLWGLLLFKMGYENKNVGGKQCK